DDTHRNSEALAQGSVIGRVDSLRARLSMRAYDRLARKPLRRLGAPQMIALYSAHDAAAVVDFLEGVDDRQRSDGAISVAYRVHDALDGTVADERARGVMHKHDGRFVGQIIETIGDALGARASAGRDHETIDVTLKDPR